MQQQQGPKWLNKARYFRGVWFIIADVSEPSVRSIFKGL